MKSAGRPGIASGTLVAALLTAVLIAILYFAWKVFGLPFVPFDVFDWFTRLLPGRVIAFGIGTMVTVIRALNLGPTSETAKMAEQAMAVFGLFVTGVVAGVVLFVILRARRARYAYVWGLALGVVLDVPAMILSLQVGQTASVPRALGAVWILAAFLAWGAAMAWADQRLIAPTPAVAAGAPAPSPETLSAVRMDRRRFLIRFGGATATITVVGAVVGELAESRRQMANMARMGMGRWSATHVLPNANDPVKPAPGTRPEFTPLERHYRIDINTIPPAVDEQRWRLKIGGLLEQPLAWTLDDLRRHPPLDQFITLSCISNPVGGDLIGTTRWTGVSLQLLLPEWRLKPGASHLKISAADGFYEIVPLETIRSDERVMLAYAWDGLPLTRDHGFPLRIYIPDVHGMKQPKWIESIEVTDHWEPGYWVRRGWDKIAQMKATAVIDTISTGMEIIHAGPKTLVPIGGIAHAGARGISKVEVQVDDGPWQPATLRAPLSPLTWVIWRYDWPFQSGTHTFTVRCYDGQGTPQIPTRSPPEPNGATGLHRKTEML